MHALITGGNGYIGGYLTHELLSNGHKVTTYDSKLNACPAALSSTKYSNKLRAFDASVNNIDRLTAAMSSVDIIYHLAARMDYNSSYRHIIRLTNTNVLGTANVIAMAKKVGINKIVYASTAAVYGNLVGAKETDKPNPVNLYGATKLGGENLLVGAYNEGLEVVILRLFNVWGGPYSRSVIKLFNSGVNTINGDGTQTRDFVHVSDVVRAFHNASVWDSGIYNVGTGQEVSIAGIHQIISGGAKPEFKEGVPEIQRSVADIEYIKKVTGWTPVTLISELSRAEIAANHSIQ